MTATLLVLLAVLYLSAEPIELKLTKLWTAWRFRRAHNMSKAELHAFDNRNF